MDHAILTPLKQEQIAIKAQKNEIDADFLRDSWLSPVILQGGWQRSENRFVTGENERTALSATVSISQDIFRSGGILHARRYADETRLVGRSALENERRQLVQEAVATLYTVRKLHWQIQKQQKLVQNAQIDIGRKREQFENGMLDSSFLDNALLDYSAKSAALIDLQMALAERESHFKTLSDHDPLSYEAPRFQAVPRARFLENNLILQLQTQQAQQQNHYRRMLGAKYLPRISVGASYQHYFSDESAPVTPATVEMERVTAYGATLTIPLDFNGRREVESAKLSHRAAQNALIDARIAQEQLYAATMRRLEQIDAQRALAQQDIAVYDSLSAQIADQLKAGQKTRDDLKIMQNAREARALDLKIYDANAQIELLTLYARLTDDPL